MTGYVAVLVIAALAALTVNTAIGLTAPPPVPRPHRGGHGENEEPPR